MSSSTKKTKEIESRTIRVQMVEGTRINGQVNIKRIPWHERVSDLVTYDDEEFLVVFKATVYGDGISEGVKQQTIFVNKKHILYAMPDDDQK